MKKETKRYALVEYLGPQIRYIDSYQEYERILSVINSHNASIKGKFYFGNVSCEELLNGKYKVVIHVYNRLTHKMTITDIDKLTSDKSEKELIEYFKNKLKTKKNFIPDINIMYFENKNKKEKTKSDFDRRIKYVPILYACDVKYLDKKYIKKCIHYEAVIDKDLSFFKEMANEFCFYHTITDKIEKLRKSIDSCERGENSYSDLELRACQLYEAFIKDRESSKKLYRDKISGECSYSRRRMRDFGFFIRNYMIPEYKKLSPVKYNQVITEEQMKNFASNEEVQSNQSENEFSTSKVQQLTLF